MFLKVLETRPFIELFLDIHYNPEKTCRYGTLRASVLFYTDM